MEQFKQLQQIYADQIHDQVRRGSVVVTEQWVFLIALALPELTYQDKKVIGVSLEAPLAQKLMYKKQKTPYKWALKIIPFYTSNSLYFC